MAKRILTKTILCIAAVAMATLGSVANADVLDLTGDEDTTTEPQFSGKTGALAGAINDGFAYDPDNPTSPFPDVSWPATGGAFHGTTSEFAVIAYDFDGTYDNIFVDLYGRDDLGAGLGCCLDRDDSFDVQLWLGGELQETIAGSIDGTFHDRVSASPGTLADSIRFVDTAASPNSLTIMELRVNGTEPAPTPTPIPASGPVGLSLLVAALGMAGFVALRRRRLYA